MSLTKIVFPESMQFSYADQDIEDFEPPVSFIFEGSEDEIVDELIEWLAQFGYGDIHIEDRENIVLEARKGWFAIHGLDCEDCYRDYNHDALWCDSMPTFTFGAGELREWLQTYRQDFIQLLRGGPANSAENAFVKVWLDNYVPDD